MRKVRITGVPMQYGGNPYFLGYNTPVTPQERSQWNQVIGEMHQQPGTYVRNWDHNQDFQNEFLKSRGFNPDRVSAIQGDMLGRNQNMPGTVTYGPQGMSKQDNWLGSQTKDQRYVHYIYEHQDAKGNPYPGAAGYSDRGTEPMTAAEMNNWNNSAYQWKSNDQGVPMNASADEVRSKLYGQPTSYAAPLSATHPGVNKASWYENGPAPDYSIDAVRSGQVAEYGGIKRRVRITHTPYGRHMQDGTMPPPAQWGGHVDVPGGSGKYAQQQSGHGYALDRFWSSPAGYPGSTSKINPYAKVGSTLPEAQDGGDINAEKQERVLGDFDQDGSLELMNVNGPSHAEGGKDVNIPSNSFVFSDTKDLKIKDPAILAIFGMQPKRGGYTPADIAKKYDLNKYKGILDNPDADDYAQKTAQLMTDSYMAKLNKLALIQEQLKGQMGMKTSAPPQQQPGMKYGGAPMFQYAGIGPMPYQGPDVPPTGSVPGNQSMMFNPEEANNVANQNIGQTVPAPYNMYPNVLTAQGYQYDMPTPDNMQSFIQQSIDKRPNAYGKPIIPNTPQGNAQYDAMRRVGWDGKEDPGTWAQRTQPEAVQSALLKSGMTKTAADAVTGNQLGNTYYGPRWQNFMPNGPDWNPTIQDVTGIGTPDQTPQSGTPPPPPGTAAKVAGPGTTIPVQQDAWRGIRMNPNFYGNLFNMLQMAQVKKFHPFEPPPQAVIPDAVFLDPTRAIAAQQEEARSGEEMDQRGDEHVARAIALARQGVAGTQAANTIGQYHNQNVGIANQANTQASQITNELFAKQANRIAELNKAGFLADRDYQREMSRLQSEWVDRWQKQHDIQVKTAWLNKVSPFFNVNPIDQMPDFKSANAQAEFYKQVYGTGHSAGPDNDKEAAAAQYARHMMDLTPGLTPNEAIKWARQQYGLMERESEMYKPGSMMPSMRYTNMPMGAGMPNTFGMGMPGMGAMYGVPAYEMGGQARVDKRANLRKFVRA